MEELSGDPTIGLSLSAMLYLRLAGGRQDPAPHVDPASGAEQIELSGDLDLARQLATSIAFTI